MKGDFMGRFRVWMKAVRAPFFTATVIPVILGSVVAWNRTGLFNWGYLWLTLMGIIFIHAGTNLSNDYFDHTSGDDEVNKTPTPFSGGSRVIQDKLIEPRKVLYAALAFFALGSLVGLYLNYVSPGNIILILGVIGIALGFFYTADPLRIGYTGFGELTVSLGFGPLVVLGSYYVQARSLSWEPLWASIPVSILIALVLYINEFPDYEADREVNKRTLVVILGKKKAVQGYFLLLCLTYLFIVLAAFFKIIPRLALVTLVTIPLALKAVRIAKVNFGDPYKLLPANSATIGLHSLVGLLLAAGYILDKVFIG